MTKPLSKSARIMALDDGQRTPQQIAALVGCLDSYVRVVLRQRKGGGTSEIDRRYRQSELGKATSKRQNDTRRGPHRAYYRAAYNAFPAEQRRKVSRDAYGKARAGGASIREAARVALNAVYKASLADPHRRELARAAYAAARKSAQQPARREPASERREELRP